MRRLEIEGARIDCEFWESRQNWGHKATLYIDGVKTGPTKYTTYYNRTWERFTYDTIAEMLIEKTKDLTADQKKAFIEKYDLFHDSRKTAEQK
jgi:hypothetical protein